VRPEFGGVDARLFTAETSARSISRWWLGKNRMGRFGKSVK
jgi:hypothetical protein